MYFQPVSNLLEALSWRIAVEICRRDPKITIRETHPGGGQYDCLSLWHPTRGHLADLNRLGSIHIFGRLDGRPADAPAPGWEDALGLGTVGMVDRLGAAIGQRTPKPLPSSTPRTLAYRANAACLGANTFRRESWQCRSGFLDTSGGGGGVVQWFERFRAAAARLDHASEKRLYATSVPFWFLLREDEPVACLHEDGTAWDREGNELVLPSLYQKRRKLWPIIERLVGDLLE